MKIFEKNVGGVDKIARAIIGVAALYAFGSGMFAGPMSYVVLFVAVAMLVTALTGSCTLYSLLGVSTCPVKKAPKQAAMAKKKKKGRKK